MGWRHTNFYSKIRQNKTTKKNQKEKKERRKDSGTKTTFIVFYSLLTQAWFTPNFRSVVGKSNSLSLPVSLLFLSCALCMWRLKCRTHCVCCCCCARARLTNESRLKKRNRKRKYRCFLKMCRSFMAITKKSFEGSARSRNQHVSLRSDELLRRSISTATRQFKVCLPDYVLFMLLFLVIAFLHAVKKKKKERKKIYQAFCL